ncbi:MAG: hypothetical protein P1P93_09200 [Gammaproteobacteria bacterium]|nr:hypothetical protein [Gammaproteobacteria bacterium]MDT8371647.1 hypothetical protein [Gammaproteobacteria bacterium]
MIYLVFTQAGFQQAKPLIFEDKATLWINADVLTNEQQTELIQANIDIYTLPDNTDPGNEKSVLAALDHVEKSAPECDIFVEYV